MWIREVAKQRPVEVVWKLFSLAEINKDMEMDEAHKIGHAKGRKMERLMRPIVKKSGASDFLFQSWRRHYRQLRKILLNGLEISWGKNMRPVIRAWVWAVNPASPWAPTRCWTGLRPRKAANRTEIGGSAAA